MVTLGGTLGWPESLPLQRRSNATSRCGRRPPRPPPAPRSGTPTRGADPNLLGKIAQIAQHITNSAGEQISFICFAMRRSIFLAFVGFPPGQANKHYFREDLRTAARVGLRLRWAESRPARRSSPARSRCGRYSPRVSGPDRFEEEKREEEEEEKMTLNPKRE